MQRAVSSLLVVFFILWILPLGYFIKPSQEKTVCDGQRAMCMCSVHFVHKSPSNPLSGISTANPNGNKEAPSNGGSAGNYFESNLSVSSVAHSSILPDFQVELVPSLQFISPIEHVPKF
jgi:hypothetical protein